MASIRRTPTGKWEVKFTKQALFPKPIYFTFDDEETARKYGAEGDALLAKDIIPTGWVAAPLDTKTKHDTLGPIIRAWLNSGHASVSDDEVLNLVFSEKGVTPMRDMNYKWCEAWVREMKVDKNLAPSTIRKRVGAVSRAFGYWARSFEEVEPPVNCLALLPRGYSTYTKKDIELAEANGKKARLDEVRERRLNEGEEERILETLNGVKRADRERPFIDPSDKSMLNLYLMIVNTGARLIEAYTLTRGQIDLAQRFIRIKTSKLKPGKPQEWRHVPIRAELYDPLVAWLEARNLSDEKSMAKALVFPFWDGHPDDLTPAGKRLSQRFRKAFDYSNMPDFTEHDLRHEATCRWFQMRFEDGSWVYRGEEINKLMGWKPNSTMAQRYASFQAEELAARLWKGVPAGNLKLVPKG